ncbi:DUF6586 family protein [Pseudomonas sp. Marseille-QA0892]
MSHERYTRTNQKLFYAGLALDTWREAAQSGAFTAPAKTQAAREEAVFHLYGAVLGLCHEVAGYYRMPGDADPSIEQFLDAGRLAATPSPEFAELFELSRNRETWLGQLLSAYTGLFQPPMPPKATKQDPTLPLIQAVAVGEETENTGLTPEMLESWRQSIKALALRFREGLSEI